MALAVDMTGKVALVTGAASGLGRATALALGGAGASIGIIDRDEAGLLETADMLRAIGVRVLVHPTDLTDVAQCTGAVAKVVETFDRLDALCNVAGVIFMTNAPEMPVADWNMTLAVNLSAPFHLIQAAIPHLLETQGAVVNVTSSAAFIGEAYLAAYCASKAGLVNLTKALAMEYMNKPIRFNAVAPGGMATGMTAGFQLPDGADPALFMRFAGMRGLVDVAQVADMVAYLASPSSSSIHGTCINIDGGITAG